MGAGSSRERLSRADMEFLLLHTHYDEKTIQEWYKGFMSDCPEGKLNTESFMKIYSKCFPQGNAAEFCDHVFRTFDADKNGSIDFKEFLLAIDVTSNGCPEEKLNWAFSMYDVDGNGWIDPGEMTKIVKSIYKMMGPNQVKLDKFDTAERRADDIFRRMDINSDGKLTRQEFVKGCLNDTNLLQLLAPGTQI